MNATSVDAAAEQRAFRDELLRHRVLVDTGVRGVYGRSAALEATVEAIDRAVSSMSAEDGAEVMRFPPVLNRRHLERSGYLESFPHLAGTIHAFDGSEQDHRALLRAVQEGADWSAAFAPAPVVLAPAACYPVYPALAGTLPPGGRLIDVMSYCFRHEPSDDAGRMQSFRMHEQVRVADPQTVAAWCEGWRDRAMAFTRALGLEARLEIASDPFFGRGGKLLAESQRDQQLKLEVTAPIGCAEQGAAIISLNCHQDHFGALFGITTADGAVAHTACVGFGLERVALALYRRHGFEPPAWPRAVLEVLRL